VRGEEREQLELLERERDLGAVCPDPPLVMMEDQPAAPVVWLGGQDGAGQGRAGGDRAGGQDMRQA
jgi:hypothetical protein